MARILCLILLFFPIAVLSQKYFISDSSILLGQREEFDLRKPSISSFERSFEKDSIDRINEEIDRFKPFRVFKKSSTIFDITRIILFSNGKFFAYYKGCIAEGITGGIYRIENNTLTISSSKNTYESLKNEFKLLDYRFFEIGTKRYLISKEGLVYLK